MYVGTAPAAPIFGGALGPVTASLIGDLAGVVVNVVSAIQSGSKRPQDYALIAGDALALATGPLAGLYYTAHAMVAADDFVKARSRKRALRRHLNFLGAQLTERQKEGHHADAALASTLLKAKLTVAEQHATFPSTPFIGPIAVTTIPARTYETRGGFGGRVGAPVLGGARTPDRTVTVPAHDEVRWGLIDPETGAAATESQLLLKYGEGFHAQRSLEWSRRPAPGAGLVPALLQNRRRAT